MLNSSEREGKLLTYISNSSNFYFKIHPGSSKFYRGDKHAHFLNALVICGLNGHIYYVSIGYGRNSDLLLFKRTGLPAFLEANDLRVLGDRGFKNPYVLFPTDPETTIEDMEYNNVMYEYRSVVENIYSRISNWNLASSKFKQDVCLQTQSLHVIYQIEVMKIDKSPPRNWIHMKNKTNL